jgi:hypothetical protein
MPPPQQAAPPPPQAQAGQPPAAYAPPAYQQQTGPQAYAPYAAAPPRPGGGAALAGGVWGIILLALAGVALLIGLVALFVALITDYPVKSVILAQCFLPPGLLLTGIFLGLQVWPTAQSEKK